MLFRKASNFDPVAALGYTPFRRLVNIGGFGAPLLPLVARIWLTLRPV
jgi:hypothetical protein